MLLYIRWVLFPVMIKGATLSHRLLKKIPNVYLSKIIFSHPIYIHYPIFMQIEMRGETYLKNVPVMPPTQCVS